MRLDEVLARTGYWVNYPARILGHSLEVLTRPLKYGQHGYENSYSAELIKRVRSCFSAAIALPTVIVGFPLASALFTISHLLHFSPIQFTTYETQDKNEDNKAKEKTNFSVLFLNTCLQGGPFATLTGEVTSLHERFNKIYSSRVDAIVDFVKKDCNAPDVLCFSEVHDLYAIDKLKENLKKEGYSYFITDIPTHPICINSGLFVASKIKIGKRHFEPYPLKHRSGVHLGALQGCMIFDLMDEQNQKITTIASTHLNYGNRKEDQASRDAQFNHIFKRLADEKTALIGGDMNYEYQNDIRRLQKFANGKKLVSLVSPHTKTTRETFKEGGNIRGRKKPEEVIDAVFSLGDNESYDLRTETIRPRLESSEKFVTDHYGALVTATKKGMFSFF